MSLSIDSHRAGEITVLTCSGRIVEGVESAALQRRIDELIAEGPYVILHLGGIEFIDSSGLGLLVRCLIRLESLHGLIRVCAPSPRVAEAFRVTGLNTLFKVFETEAAAVAGFYDLPSGKRADAAATNILCVVESADLLAYVGHVLRQSGYVVVTTTNLPDALTLLTATRPRLVVISEALRAQRGTAAADTFNSQVDLLTVIERAANYSGKDAAAAGQELLDRVRAALGGGVTEAKL
jgi:anti-sigma B factor antagonist